jgi:MinD superfamily P-loop ATPase
MVLAVTEPTQSGLHDLERVVCLAGHFKLPVAVVINKFDLNEDMTHEIERFCRTHRYEVVGRIPYSDVFTRAMVVQKTVLEEVDEGVAQAVTSAWEKVKQLVME